jgi:hypothetical protein
MTEISFPYPPLQPLERLHVYDSLTVNAERWQLAHEYHRSRQNLIYQSLNQPGIVCGLGVKVIAPPQGSSERQRALDAQRNEQRWIEIQPGIAIDMAGNPIVVNDDLQPIDRAYRIAAPAPMMGHRTIYVVVSYAEPNPDADRQEKKLLERFRFDQKTEMPLPHEVELCRIKIQPGGVSLAAPVDPFNPQINEIDLRHRVQAQARPEAWIRVGVVSSVSQQAYENLKCLMQSLSGLYPKLQAEIIPIELTNHVPFNEEQLQRCDLLYLQPHKLSNLETTSDRNLRNYLNAGGAMLVETNASQIEELAIQKWLEPRCEWHDLKVENPLRSHPFLFTQLPTFYDCSTQIALNGGVICLTGCLSEAWGGHNLSRSEIREAQELGINILHFAWRRRHFKRLLQ